MTPKAAHKSYKNNSKKDQEKQTDATLKHWSLSKSKHWRCKQVSNFRPYQIRRYCERCYSILISNWSIINLDKVNNITLSLNIFCQNNKQTVVTHDKNVVGLKLLFQAMEGNNL